MIPEESRTEPVYEAHRRALFTCSHADAVRAIGNGINVDDLDTLARMLAPNSKAGAGRLTPDDINLIEEAWHKLAPLRARGRAIVRAA